MRDVVQSRWARRLLAAIAGTALAGAALGDEVHRSFFDTEANTGAYADLAIGPTDAAYDAGAFVHSGAVDVSGRPLGFQLGGGYRPMPAWSGELDYLGLGRVSAGGSYVSTSGWLLSGLLYLPTPFINVYGRLGVLDANSHGRCACSAGSGPLYVLHQTGFDAMYGVGLITNRRGSVNLRLEFDKFQISHASRATMASIGLVWSFL
jgi:hypothetical protein